jgi:IclR family transcriptional regulator, KDG regulon repressor
LLHRLKLDTADGSQTAYKSISRAAEILSCLSDGKNTVTEIAQSCKLSKPTVSRLLKTLEQSSFVIRDPFHRKFYLGSLLNRLMVNPKTTHLNLITISVEEMNRLAETYGETVFLGILVGIQNIRLHMILGKHNVRIYDDDVRNLSTPQIQGAPAKALLSQLSRRDLELVLNNIKSENADTDSVIENKEFFEQLNQINIQGYSVTQSEKIVGSLALSSPIKGYQFPVALSIAGAESRLAPKVQEMIPDFIATASRISHKLSKLSLL